MKTSLMPHQKDGLEFILSRMRVLNASEMGTGKTLVSIAAIERSKATKVLICCPASLRYMWENDIIKEIQGASVTHLPGKVTHEDKNLQVYIVSHPYLTKPQNVEHLKTIPFDLIISDEFHQGGKTWKSKTCKGFVELTKEFRGRLILMTGTPATNKGTDYYPYCEILEPGKHGSYYSFANEYCEKLPNRWAKSGMEFGAVRKDKIGALKEIFKRFTFKVKLRYVVHTLPPVTVRNIPVDVDASIVAECLNVPDSVIERAVENGGAMPGHIMQLRRSIGMGKVKHVIELIENCGVPVVVFCAHTDVVNEIIEGVSKTCYKITGDESAEEKQAVVEKFQRGDGDVVVANIKAGGVGITLTRASYMIMAELDWSPANMEQAEARIVRIGQTARTVNIEYCIGKNTLDERVLKILGRKNAFLKEVC